MTPEIVPEAGQLVEVRRRQYVVQEVRPSSLEPDPLAIEPERSFSLVRLSSIEEDSLGEKLEVIWELEPGTQVHRETGRLPAPEGFDDPTYLGAFLNAVGWGAISSADPSVLQSPFRSGISIEDYQLDPVVRALKMPRVNLLVADDVGLGKTIEAGLVAEELILRHRADTIMIVVPASLQIKWRDEMKEKFGLPFEIVDSELMRDLRRRRGLHANPWTHYPRLITSIDYLKREGPMRRFKETLPGAGEPRYPRRFDLLIIDEAHNVAPSGGGNYAVDSQRTLAIRTIAPHFEHRLFLTATPHNGYWESFSALLELLDDQRFAVGIRPPKDRLRTIMVRRLKSEIENPDGSKRFPDRRIIPLEVDYTDEERDAHRWLKEYTDLRKKAAADESGRTATEFVLKLLKKRMFSSPAAFLATLEKHERTLRGLSDDPKRGRRPSAGALRREFLSTEETADDEERESLTGDAVVRASGVFDSLTDREKVLLRKLKDWAHRAAKRADSKAEALLDWLEKTVRTGGDWNDERVILFTEYRATQKWLQGILAAEGYAGDGRLLVLYGGMKTEDRESIKAAFQARPSEAKVRILLATDAASEGIDLQKHCHRLVHVEIPWNPNVLEQRNGRIDRHGQKHEPLVHHFVGQGYRDLEAGQETKAGTLEGDLEFLMVAVRKLKEMKEDLFGKVSAVVADQVEQAMLGERTRLETEAVEKEGEPVREYFRFERELREEIKKLRVQLEESRAELHVTPEAVKNVVDVALTLANQPPLLEAQVPGLWPDPDGIRESCPVFRMPIFTRPEWARCAEGLEHPHTNRRRPVTFDHEIAADRDDVVLVHLNHRLVQMAQRLLRAEIWSRKDRRSLFRVTVMAVPDDLLEGRAVVAHGRVVVTGGDSHHLHEEVIQTGGWLRDGRFRRTNVTETKQLFEGALPLPVSEKVKAEITDDWSWIQPRLEASLEARMKERTENLDSILERRREGETGRARSVLEDLQKTIQSKLDEQPPPQLELWPEPEREQLERNRESLHLRLKSIPEQIEREVESIAKRYSDPVPRLFPVSVTFLVPQSEADI